MIRQQYASHAFGITQKLSVQHTHGMIFISKNVPHNIFVITNRTNKKQKSAAGHKIEACFECVCTQIVCKTYFYSRTKMTKLTSTLRPRTKCIRITFCTYFALTGAHLITRERNRAWFTYANNKRTHLSDASMWHRHYAGWW